MLECSATLWSASKVRLARTSLDASPHTPRARQGAAVREPEGGKNRRVVSGCRHDPVVPDTCRSVPGRRSRLGQAGVRRDAGRAGLPLRRGARDAASGSRGSAAGGARRAAARPAGAAGGGGLRTVHGTQRARGRDPRRGPPAPAGGAPRAGGGDLRSLAQGGAGPARPRLRRAARRLPAGAIGMLDLGAAPTPVAGASRALSAALRAWPREEAAAPILGNGALARLLGWPQFTPLLATGLRRVDLRGDPAALESACHRVVALSGVAALGLAADPGGAGGAVAAGRAAAAREGGGGGGAAVPFAGRALARCRLGADDPGRRHADDRPRGPAALRPAGGAWRGARADRAGELPALRVVTMRQGGERSALDRELADLPPALRWREWMRRIEAVLFASARLVPRQAEARAVRKDARVETKREYHSSSRPQKALLRPCSSLSRAR
jgi:hypothetical protein